MGEAFLEFPKIARLSRDCVVTEKIDGTNAQIEIVPIADLRAVAHPHAIATNGTDGLLMFCGSRSRYITPTDDNFGFAKWTQTNAAELFKLGAGRHFGEWWGSGIQRGYGLTEKRFSLFNTHKWGDDEVRPACCHVVPVLMIRTFDQVMEELPNVMAALRIGGSVAAPGFMKPEGVVLFHSGSSTLFKKTIEKDEQPKGGQAHAL